MLAVALFFCALPRALAADPGPIARDPQWLALLHERDGTGLIDDPAFYLAPDGRSEPGAELAATLSAFQQPPPSDPDRDPRCLWPARYQFLDGLLGLSRARPSPACPSWSARSC